MIITIEGADRSGKSTQAAKLVRWLGEQGYKARLFVFPDYSTPTGGRIQEYLESGEADPETIHSLMAENRRERLTDILHAKAQTHVIVMDRYCESNIIYGTANGLDRDWLEGLDRQMPKSDAVILLDVDVGESQNRRNGGDVFESDLALMRRVAEGYRREAARNGWYVVLGGLDIPLVHTAVVGCATMAISERRRQGRWEDAAGDP